MRFLIYVIILFSFFHWLVGFGIAGSIFASIFAFILSPFIWAGILALSVLIWAMILCVFAFVCAPFSYLFK